MGLPTTSARWPPCPVRALSTLLKTVNGKPLRQLAIDVIVQPPIRNLAAGLVKAFGNCQMPEKLYTWRK